MKSIAVLGAGAAGCATAALLARRGFEVRLWSRSAERLEPIVARGGIEVLSQPEAGFVPLHSVTTDLGAAVDGADLIQVTTPANGHPAIAAALAAHLKDEHVVLILSGSCGSLEFARIWREMGVRARALLGETVTMPVAARIRGPAQVTIRLPMRLRTAAFPGTRTGELCEVVSRLYQVIPVRNVLDTGINNPNFVIHPLPMVANYAAAERADWRFSLMNEGMSASVLRAMDAYDAERMSIARALGLPALSIDDLYNEFGAGPGVYRSPGEPMGFRDRIHERYLDEDVPYGSMLLSDLGDVLGVETPVIDATNVLACALTGRTYRNEARTLQRLGVAGLDGEQIMRFADEGRIPG